MKESTRQKGSAQILQFERAQKPQSQVNKPGKSFLRQLTALADSIDRMHHNLLDDIEHSGFEHVGDER